MKIERLQSLLHLLGTCLILLTPFDARPVQAGSPIGDLLYRFGCGTLKGEPEIYYDDRGVATVGIRPELRGEPVLFVNENLAFEQPYEVVAFEYFSACEQLELSRELVDFSREGMEDLVLEADCRAAFLLRRSGVARGHEAFAIIVEEFSYWRADDQYLGVSFEYRAENLDLNCPL